MRLLVGLGNPGKEYEATRHNAGFWCVDRVGEQLKVTWKKFKEGVLATSQVGEEKVLLFKPHTYMNGSGLAVRQVVDYYNLTEAEIAVAVDDVYVKPGSVRIRQGGGDGGHNGLKSLLSQLAEPDFWRVRLGVGLYEQRPEHRLHQPPMDEYVLQKLPPDERKQVLEAIDNLVPNLVEWLRSGELSDETIHPN